MLRGSLLLLFGKHSRDMLLFIANAATAYIFATNTCATLNDRGRQEWYSVVTQVANTYK